MLASRVSQPILRLAQVYNDDDVTLAADSSLNVEGVGDTASVGTGGVICIISGTGETIDTTGATSATVVADADTTGTISGTGLTVTTRSVSEWTLNPGSDTVTLAGNDILGAYGGGGDRITSGADGDTMSPKPGRDDGHGQWIGSGRGAVAGTQATIEGPGDVVTLDGKAARQDNLLVSPHRPLSRRPGGADCRWSPFPATISTCSLSGHAAADRGAPR